MKNATPIFAIIISPALYFINFIPLSLTALVFIIFILGSSAERIRKDEKRVDQNKIILMSAVYILMLLLLWGYFWIHKLPLFFNSK